MRLACHLPYAACIEAAPQRLGLMSSLETNIETLASSSAMLVPVGL